MRRILPAVLLAACASLKPPNATEPPDAREGAVIPSDRDRLHESCVQRSLPGKDSKIHRGIARLARKLTGVPEPRKRSMPSILSFGKFRKVATGAPVAKVG